jgi:4-methyl-5(b-hydroxyethyl)-thiazole monophosphate biosynthesis
MISYLFLAQGFEEVEALTVVDLLRRAGINVQTVSITEDRKVIGAHGIPVEADRTIAGLTLNDVEWLIAPGGMPGAENLHQSRALADLLEKHAAANGKIAAICAAPAVVLAQAGLLKGVEATCYPGFEPLCKQHGAKMVEKPVVAHGNIITANGPASAMLFALAIINKTLGISKAQEVAQGLLLTTDNTPYYF